MSFLTPVPFLAHQKQVNRDTTDFTTNSINLIIYFFNCGGDCGGGDGVGFFVFFLFSVSQRNAWNIDIFSINSEFFDTRWKFLHRHCLWHLWQIWGTRSLGALRAPTSRLRPFGPALGPSGLFDNVLHATAQWWNSVLEIF